MDFDDFFWFFTPPSLFVAARSMMVARAHTQPAQCNAAAEQQPEGWRFVPDTILPGYWWAPQWVPARTPTVHWCPISGKAVGGPNHSSAQRTVQIHPKHSPSRRRKKVQHPNLVEKPMVFQQFWLPEARRALSPTDLQLKIITKPMVFTLPY